MIEVYDDFDMNSRDIDNVGSANRIWTHNNLMRNIIPNDYF